MSRIKNIVTKTRYQFGNIGLFDNSNIQYPNSITLKDYNMESKDKLIKITRLINIYDRTLQNKDKKTSHNNRFNKRNIEIREKIKSTTKRSIIKKYNS